MERRMTRQFHQRILKNQPEVSIRRINFSNVEKFGIILNNVAANGDISEDKKQKQQQQQEKKLSNDMSQGAIQTENQPESNALALITAPRQQINRNVKIFVKNAVVLVKWPYYPDWPAIITSVQGKFVHVKFFGDQGRTAKVKMDRCALFEENIEYVLQTLRMKKWPLYSCAVKEVETVLRIPKQLSISGRV